MTAEKEVAEMKTVWVVEEGESGEYRAIGVFSSQANAEVIASLCDGHIVVYPIDPFLNEVSEGRKPFHIVMKRIGSVRVEPMHWPVGDEDWKPVDFHFYTHRSEYDSYLIGDVFARDKAHAIEIANEIRANYIAEGKWER